MMAALPVGFWQERLPLSSSDSRYLTLTLSSSFSLSRVSMRCSMGLAMSSMQFLASFSIMASIITAMYNQKFNPYGQFPSKSNQLYEQEYEEEESQPLIQQVDDSYEPTDKEVKEYAIETLGMRFPEDEGLLYLAREGLKAPLPDNWVPYEGRDGQVYYKHRITQEKTYDHPTDLEYRKKYEQQKEKMARKNLKSMNMKASAQLPVSNSSNLFSSKLGNSSAFPAEPAAKLDPRIEQQYDEELEQFEERLRREWKEVQMQQRQRCENRLKKLKQEYEAEIDKLFSGKQKEVRVQDKIRQQKEKIKARVQEQAEEALRAELRDFEKDLQLKNRDFRSVYEEDMQLKLSKYQQEREGEAQEREKRVAEAVQRAQRERESRKKQMEETLKRMRGQFERGENREIEAATAQALEQQLLAIRQSYALKLKEKQAQLQRQYQETNRILGFDQTAYLAQIAAKKSRIKAVSQQKIESYKKKELLSLNQQTQNELQGQLKALKLRLQQANAASLQRQRREQEQRLRGEKERAQREFKGKVQASVQNIYEQAKGRVRSYQAEMNKKLSSVQQRFISDIYGKARGSSKELVFRIEAKEKEVAIENKTMMIKSLRRQQELERITLQLMKLQSEIYRCRDEHEIDQQLMRLAKEHDLDYRTEKYLRHEQAYRDFREKYRKDKEFLASVMASLQGSKGSAVGSQALLRQYNQDVRAMRDNEDALKRMESLLKRAEVNDKAALEELSSTDTDYKEIELRGQLARTVPPSLSPLQEAPQERGVGVVVRDMEGALREHSRFLSAMRGQLNRKLYQIRSGAYY